MIIMSRVEGFEEDVIRLREIATQGFVVAINLSWAGPEALHSEFPQEWRERYEDKSYFYFDPVFHWAAIKTGYRRWSEVGFPDPRGVMKQAANYGLKYGLVISERGARYRSFMSLGREDRELTGLEIDEVCKMFSRWLSEIADRPELSLGELQVLKCLALGFGQAKVASELGISEGTVKKRAQSAMKKFGAETRAQAVSIAVEKRYFGLD